MNNYFIAPNTIVEEDVAIGDGTKIWYFSHIRSGAKIGRNCNIGDYCYIDKGVIIGDDVRIGNGVSIYEGVIIKDKAFIGNNATFTNVRRPEVGKRGKVVRTIVEESVYIGANSTIEGGVAIEKTASVGDGAVVFYDVPAGYFVAAPGISKIKKLFSLKVSA